MTFVKICGITRSADAELACELGAGALGFNFFSGSKRATDSGTVRRIGSRLPQEIWRVGVFVNHSREEITRICRAAQLDTIQLHGDEPPDFCENWDGMRVIKALRLGEGAPQYDIEAYLAAADLLLLDRFEPDEAGGTGKEISEEALEPFRGAMSRILLAGGITPENAAEKISRYQPFGIDTASGVESAPGVKDGELLQRFFQAVVK